MHMSPFDALRSAKCRVKRYPTENQPLPLLPVDDVRMVVYSFTHLYIYQVTGFVQKCLIIVSVVVL